MPDNGNNTINDLPKQTLTRSATQQDIAKYIGAGVVQFLVPAFGAQYAIASVPPELPPLSSVSPYNKTRDIILSMLPLIEGNWANACNIVISKVIARGTTVEGPVSRRIENVNQMMEWCEARLGFDTLIEKSILDFLNTSNGAWFEIERVSRSPSAKIIAINHLDSLRVWRTGDPNIPAVYWDLRGGYHELRWWECFDITDMKSARAGWWYGGECAAERCFRDIRAVAAMNTFFDEKITGGGYSKIVLIPGVATKEQIDDAINVAKEKQMSQGVTYYQGALLIPFYGDKNALDKVLEINLKGMPEGWDRTEELEIRQMAYAVALGVPFFLINPRLSAKGALGVGQQSQIIDDAERGSVVAKFIKQFTHKINKLVTPKATVLSLQDIDLRDEEQKAKNRLTRAQARAAMRGTAQVSGEVSQIQSLYLAIEDGDVPREFINAQTPVDETMTDQEKPMSESDQAALENAEAMQSAQESAPEEQAGEEMSTTKEVGMGRYISRNSAPPIWESYEIPIIKQSREPKHDDFMRLLLGQERSRARELFALAQTRQQKSEGIPMSDTAMIVHDERGLASHRSIRSKETSAKVDALFNELAVTVKEIVNQPDPIVIHVPPTDNREIAAALQEFAKLFERMIAAPLEFKPQINVAPSPAPSVSVKPNITIEPTPIQNVIEMPEIEEEETTFNRDDRTQQITGAKKKRKYRAKAKRG